MKFIPRPFQQIGIDHAVDFLANAGRDERRCYAAPTGCGKSVVELAIQEKLITLGHRPWIITPREEIVAGMLDKLNATGDDMFSRFISTPVRLRNRLMSGEIEPPTHLIYDEGHHHNAETWQQIGLLSGLAPAIALTASPYRGSPKGTTEFREHWGDPIWLISYQEAIDEGYISMPSIDIVPLVDDDIVTISSSGEFEVTSLEAATVDRLGDMAKHVRDTGWYTDKWDRATIFALPSSGSCIRFQNELHRLGLPCAVVTAETPKADRAFIFDAVVNRVMALLHIDVVSEGVDLPLRRYIDLAPTMSPVKWVQRFGRITRPKGPGEAAPEYICCNRNLQRHAYILEGIVPVSAMVKSEMSFPRTERAHSRVLGLEAIGRFKPVATKLCNGLFVYTYSLSVQIGTASMDYCCIVHPTNDPVWAAKINPVVDGVRQWGCWQQCDPPAGLTGFASVPPKALSPKQEAWWKRAAATYGLDPTQEVTRKNFQVLPVLKDLGLTL